MGTRSLIAYQDPTTQEYHSVYCHWDGYVSFNGQILEKVYNNLELVKSLISKGDISTMYNQREADGVLCAPLHYQLWRDEDWNDVKPNVTSDLKSLFELADDRWADYLYVFTDGKWMYSGNLDDATSLQSLTDAVESVDAEYKFSDGEVSQIKDAISAIYGVPMVATMPADTDSDDNQISCISTFVGNVFGYKTNTQWVFNTMDWLNDTIKMEKENPLNDPSKINYRALMRDIAQALDEIDSWGEVCDLEEIEAGLRDSLECFDLDNAETLYITVDEYQSAFNDINQKLADGAYLIK